MKMKVKIESMDIKWVWMEQGTVDCCRFELMSLCRGFLYFQAKLTTTSFAPFQVFIHFHLGICLKEHQSLKLMAIYRKWWILKILAFLSRLHKSGLILHFGNLDKWCCSQLLGLAGSMLIRASINIMEEGRSWPIYNYSHSLFIFFFNFHFIDQKWILPFTILMS